MVVRIEHNSGASWLYFYSKGGVLFEFDLDSLSSQGPEIEKAMAQYVDYVLGNAENSGVFVDKG